MKTRKILFLAEGATMSHFVRPLVLAESISDGTYDVYLCAPKQFRKYSENAHIVSAELKSMPGELFLANIARGSPPFPAKVLREYVQEDRHLIRTFRPDLVIGDMRLSLPVSARLEGVPCALIMNAYWSPYARRRSILPSLPLTQVVPPRLLSPLYRIMEPLAFRYHVAQMNRVRREFGVPDLGPDLRAAYVDGDFVLYPDVPEFVPTNSAPPTHFYVGICDWTPPVPRPEWWDKMRSDSKPKVFVSLGSSGPVRVAPTLLRVLSRMDVSVILSTSGRVTGPVAYQADLLPFRETAALASVVVSHGGSGGLYPAMAAGTPVLAIPSNADMQLSTAALVDSGAGLGVRVEEATEARLRKALERLLSDSSFRNAARRWADVFARYDSAALFRDFLKNSAGLPPGRA
jgi:UDP:flavonoid glycosyltransferase YjiC (YdhE family)